MVFNPKKVGNTMFDVNMYNVVLHVLYAYINIYIYGGRRLYQHNKDDF